MPHCASANAVVLALSIAPRSEQKSMTIIYKIDHETSWAAARVAGHFLGSPDDVRDGYIHFSTAAQVRATAAKYFAGHDDLVIAAIDTGPLGAALKWEAARGGALFPHLYAGLPMAAVLWTKPLPRAADGSHVFPAEIEPEAETR